MFTTFHAPRSTPRGMALIGAFIVMALMVAIAIALLQVTTANATITDNTHERMQALMMAQAGISASVNEINLNKALSSTNRPGSPSASWGGQQQYSVTATDNGNNTYTIVSIGTFSPTESGGNTGIVRRKLQAVAQAPTTAGNFIAGAFGLSSLTLTGVAHTNSYDSSLGATYTQQVANAGTQTNYDNTVGNGGNVGSNKTVSGVGNIIVHGAATPGPGYTVSLSGGATVTGSQAAATQTYDFPTSAYSPTVTSSGGFQMSGNAAQTLTAGTYRYDSFKQSGGTLTITGAVNLYIDGDMTQTGQGVMILATGATLNIFQGPSGKFSLAGQGVQNPDQIPSRFNIISSSTSTVDITGQGNQFATVYAPSADVKISGQGELFGAVIGNNVTLNGLGTFHFDKAATSPGIKQRVVIVAYWEIDY